MKKGEGKDMSGSIYGGPQGHQKGSELGIERESKCGIKREDASEVLAEVSRGDSRD